MRNTLDEIKAQLSWLGSEVADGLHRLAPTEEDIQQVEWDEDTRAFEAAEERRRQGSSRADPAGSSAAGPTAD
jgi:hypothetical protein